MWSEYSLEVVDAVARNGSFSAAAQELHRAERSPHNFPKT